MSDRWTGWCFSLARVGGWVVLAASMFVVGYRKGHDTARKQFEIDAVKFGYAEWYCDDEGNPFWRFKPQK